MKISCQTCQAKYTIADEKVVGKVVKIKCKKCGSTIVVNGNDPTAAPPDAHGHAAMGGGEEEDGESTKIFMEPAPGAAGGGADEWTVNVTDEDQRTMTSAAIAIEISKGIVTQDTYVWKDGMADWLPIVEVPELAPFLGAAPSAAPAATPAPAYGGGGGGLGGTMMMDQGPAVSPLAARPAAAAAASPAASPAGAARRAGARPGNVNLFGGGSSEPAAGPPGAGGDKHTGERNENSVLFSLSALTATENAAKSSKKDDAVLDMSPSKPRNGGRAGFDDIMNLGGGGIGGGMGASPALAPPPLLAPVVEAPPPPQPVQAMQMSPGMSGGMPYSSPTPAKKSPVGIIIGAVIALALIGGVAVFALKGGGPPPVASATPDAATAPTAAAATPPSAAPTAAPTAIAAADTTTPTAAAPDTSGASSAVANGGAATPGKMPAGGSTPGASTGKATSAPTPDAKTAAAAVTPPPADTGTPAPPPAAGGGNGEFNRGAASAALGAAAGGAKGCKKADGPTGAGRVKVTFAPSGNVTTAQVDGPPFAGTSVGGCIAGAFRGAHVPPFDGSSVTVTKSFSIN